MEFPATAQSLGYTSVFMNDCNSNSFINNYLKGNSSWIKNTKPQSRGTFDSYHHYVAERMGTFLNIVAIM